MLSSPLVGFIHAGALYFEVRLELPLTVHNVYLSIYPSIYLSIYQSPKPQNEAK